jgi:hypothetical protein
MPDPSFRIVRAPPGLIWRALDGDQVVGAVSALLRPNGRWFVHFDLCQDDSYGALLAAVADNTDSDLYTAVDERNKDALALFERLGFKVVRRESIVAIPTDSEVTGLHVTDEPDGVIVISANDAFEDQLRLLVLCKNVGFSLRAFDAGEDLVGVLGPGKRDGVVVPAIDERADGGGEFLD